MQRLERETTIVMSRRVARLDRDRPFQILNRLLQISRLAREYAHGIERTHMIGLDVQYLPVDLSSGCDLSLLPESLRSCKLLRESRPGVVRHRQRSSAWTAVRSSQFRRRCYFTMSDPT